MSESATMESASEIQPEQRLFLRSGNVVKRMVLLSMCFAFTCLGNSMQPISLLALFQPLPALYLLKECSVQRQNGCHMHSLRGATFLALAGGYFVAFLGIFSGVFGSAKGLLLVFGIATLAVALYFFLVLVPQQTFATKFPASPYSYSAFPILHTAFFVIVPLIPGVGAPIAAPAYAFLDYRPLVQLAALTGIAGIHFCTAYLIAIVAGGYRPMVVNRWSLGLVNPPAVQLRYRSRHAFTCIALLVALLIYGCGRQYRFTFFQKSIDETYPGTIQVTCVLGRGAGLASEETADILRTTADHVTQGTDAVVLWSEAAVWVEGEEQEAELLGNVTSLAAAHNTTFIGVTYALHEVLGEQDVGLVHAGSSPAVEQRFALSKGGGRSRLHNRFVLVASDGSIAWQYDKAHPVPFVETGVTAGPAQVPVADSPWGVLGGAICFDLAFAGFTSQAGRKRVALMLQPSNAWGSIGYRHFLSNGVRAVENGFTLVQCGSGGVSGAVSPLFQILHQEPTLYSGSSSYDIPTPRHLTTMYPNGGFLLGWLCVVLAVLHYLAVLTPMELLHTAATRMPKLLRDSLVSSLGLDEEGASFWVTDAQLELEQGLLEGASEAPAARSGSAADVDLAIPTSVPALST